MRSIHRILTFMTLFILSVRVLGQTNNEYEKEEMNVINSFLYRIIDFKGNKLDTNNKKDTSIIYFDKRQECILNPTFYNGSYKNITYIKRLENNYLGESLIDDSKIKKTSKIKLIFEDVADYNLDKYEKEGVIGTFSISRISFNKNFTTGYFYFRIYCGEECGWGGLVKAVKTKKSWTVGKYLSIWVN